MFISVVGGVFAAAALVGWVMYRSAKSMDRAERDPKYKRRLLYIGAAIYSYGLVAGVAQVLSGDAPPATLLAAPIPLIFVWFYLRAAKRMKIPPD
jgi:amino acid transporter